jgi:hypothetical protein
MVTEGRIPVFREKGELAYWADMALLMERARTRPRYVRRTWPSAALCPRTRMRFSSEPKPWRSM